MKNPAVKNDFDFLEFIRSIPPMVKNVWPGIWPLIIIVSLFLYFGSPGHLDGLSFSDWASLHVVILIGMISLTIYLYNAIERPLSNMAVMGLWFMATAICMMADFLS